VNDAVARLIALVSGNSVDDLSDDENLEILVLWVDAAKGGDAEVANKQKQLLIEGGLADRSRNHQHAAVTQEDALVHDVIDPPRQPASDGRSNFDWK
jgi:hypothetical protein